ncbi:FlxA-like family protein [Pectinatus frisingensis]|uniref:FlxA-like family protein n=1 Tax=Pectinatus frisingensis TaxID=865 RepID=UPI0018C5900F|nr:FlxA-like family protein [Pectinatus frisingensis]
MSMTIKDSIVSKTSTAYTPNNTIKSSETNTNTPAYSVDVTIKNRLEGILKNPNLIKNIEESLNNIDLSINTIGNEPTGILQGHMHEGMFDADFDATLSFFCGRRTEDKMPCKLKPEAKKALAKYYNTTINIQKGGKNTFKKYNLEYAAIAAYSSNKLANEKAQSSINAGNYSTENYQKIKTMANDLQKDSGIYISIDTTDSNVEIGAPNSLNLSYLAENTNFASNKITFSYNNTLLTLGGNRLNFMADHKEAESVWVNLAHGNYKNDDEVISALQHAGYNKIADDYTQQIYFVNGNYDKENGELWKGAVGYTAGSGDSTKYDKLRKSLFGSDDISFDYTQDELNKAYKNAPTEYENLQKYPLDREYLNFDTYNKTDSKKSDSSSNQIQALRKRISALNKQLHELKSNRLNQPSKAEIINTLEKNIQTIQQQIDNILENKIKNTLQ